MTFRFRNLSMHHQITLIIVVTSVLALSLATAATLVLSYQTNLAELHQRQSTLARITADNTSASVAFRSQTGAEETLAALGGEPTVLEAIVLDSEGEEIARYARVPEQSLVLLVRIFQPQHECIHSIPTQTR